MEDLPTRTAEEIARRERKLAARVWNDRIKSLAAIGQGVVLILLGVGGLRFLLDPAAPEVSYPQLFATASVALVVELAVLYILGRQRPEE